MCGFAGIATSSGRALSLRPPPPGDVLKMSEVIAHRGPDAGGVWHDAQVAIAHRRLSIIDPTPAGAQPMTTDEGPTPRLVIAYNGELYNNDDLRAELARTGVSFRSSSDTETLLRALDLWGMQALPRLRGMFAFALYDTQLKLLTLVRDPLGIKPAYFAVQGGEVIFASEVTAILAHPRFSARPNFPMISAYSTTIRTVLGNETLFEGVHALAPGQMLRCDLSGERPVLHLSTWWEPGPHAPAHDDESLARVIRDSVRRHLRSDVPVCALLSGGLDSTITATIARQSISSLRTYCAGGRSDNDDDDMHHARRVAASLGTQHAEAVVEAGDFHERWGWMIDRLGVPLSTPNEVAIYTVARRLRDDGCVVTISGEGADELFAGYSMPLDAASSYIRDGGDEAGASEHELRATAWTPLDFKPGVFRADTLERAGHDDLLRTVYAREMEHAVRESGSYGLGSHLAFQRRINLTGLLGRLDTATMLAGVEGRTPFADAEVLRAASALPMERKYRGGVALAAGTRTKIALRRAFHSELPPEVLTREKASFPLPFQEWIAPRVPELRRSRFAAELFRPEAIEAVCADPLRLWALAWPMLNLSIWGDRWWGG